MTARRDDPVEAEIRDLTHDGRGVAELDGQPVFVAGALPNERVMLRPKGRRRRVTEAELHSVLEPSPDRVEPRCRYFGRCGGCSLQHLHYEAQLRFKQRSAEEALRRIGGVEPEQWLDPVPSRHWNYRRRARLSARYVHGKARTLVGFRERATTYVTDMESCPVLAPPLDSALGELSEIVTSSSVKDRLPQVELAVGDENRAIVLRVLDAPPAADSAGFRSFGERHGLDVYLQSAGPGTATPLGEARTLSYALPDFDVEFEFAPTDFVQINAGINAQMVAELVAAAAPEPGDRVLDLYCGLGNFSLPLARHAGSVLGVEGDAGLVARAARNAERNGIGNTNFLAADLAQRGWSFLQESWDLVILDPPRTGAEAVVAELAAASPRRIVYVSCHPATLARDARVILEDSRYRLRTARVFDMFPHTHHVELMTCFELSARS